MKKIAIFMLLFLVACEKPGNTGGRRAGPDYAGIFDSPHSVIIKRIDDNQEVEVSSEAELRSIIEAFSWEFIGKRENFVPVTEELKQIAVVKYPVGAPGSRRTVDVVLLENHEVLYYASMTSAYRVRMPAYWEAVCRVMQEHDLGKKKK